MTIHSQYISSLKYILKTIELSLPFELTAYYIRAAALSIKDQ